MRCGILVALVVALTACGGSNAPAVTTVNLSVGYSEPVADNLPLWLARDGGYFAKHNLIVDATQITSIQGMPALLSSQIDFDDIGGSEAISAGAQGADVVVLATLTPVYPYSMYVAPGINSAADMKGKKVATTKTGGSLDITLKVAFKKLGLDPDKDVQFIQTGSVPNVITTMISGQAQITVSKPPESLQLEAKGFKVFLNLAKDKLPASSVCIVARKAWVAQHQDLTQRYIDAIIEAIAREKKDKDFAIKVLGQNLKSDDTVALTASYNLYAVDVLPQYPYPKPEQFVDSKEVLGRNNDKAKNFDVTKILDDSFVKSAASRKVGG
jgi:NitT/TauT family transport system substrate-binding protein